MFDSKQFEEFSDLLNQESLEEFHERMRRLLEEKALANNSSLLNAMLIGFQHELDMKKSRKLTDEEKEYMKSVFYDFIDNVQNKYEDSEKEDLILVAFLSFMEDIDNYKGKKNSIFRYLLECVEERFEWNLPFRAQTDKRERFLLIALTESTQTDEIIDSVYENTNFNSTTENVSLKHSDLFYAYPLFLRQKYKKIARILDYAYKNNNMFVLEKIIFAAYPDLKKMTKRKMSMELFQQTLKVPDYSNHELEIQVILLHFILTNENYAIRDYQFLFELTILSEKSYYRFNQIITGDALSVKRSKELTKENELYAIYYKYLQDFYSVGGNENMGDRDILKILFSRILDEKGAVREDFRNGEYIMTYGDLLLDIRMFLTNNEELKIDLDSLKLDDVYLSMIDDEEFSLFFHQTSDVINAHDTYRIFIHLFYMLMAKENLSATILNTSFTYDDFMELQTDLYIQILKLKAMRQNSVNDIDVPMLSLSAVAIKALLIAINKTEEESKKNHSVVLQYDVFSELEEEITTLTETKTEQEEELAALREELKLKERKINNLEEQVKRLDKEQILSEQRHKKEAEKKKEKEKEFEMLRKDNHSLRKFVFAKENNHDHTNATLQEKEDAKAAFLNFLNTNDILVIGGHTNWVQKLKRELGEYAKNVEFVDLDKRKDLSSLIRRRKHIFFITSYNNHGYYEHVKRNMSDFNELHYLSDITNIEQTFITMMNRINDN